MKPRIFYRALTPALFGSLWIRYLVSFSPLFFVLSSGLFANETTVALVPTCPAANFHNFLNAFINSESLQRAFTKFPLKKQYLDLNAEPEPKTVVMTLDREQTKFPIIPLEVERKAKSLDLRIDNLSVNQAKVILFKSDTDYQVSYFFSKASCWRLERVEDWSL